MVSYRGLCLVVIISLANIVLADVLVQPGYLYGNNPQYQSVPQYPIRSPAVQYHAQQLPNQESTRNLVQAQTDYYDQDQARSLTHKVTYPHRFDPYHHHNHYLLRPHHMHYAKIGGHGYKRPSVFVGNSQSPPLTVQYWFKRSRRSVPTSIDSSKSAIVAHDNDVAAKSSLTDDKHPTAIDALLPEHEPTDTNDKRVENRQTKNDQALLLGLYPEKMYPEYRQIPSTQLLPYNFPKNTMQYHISNNYPKTGRVICKENKDMAETRYEEYTLTNKPIKLPSDKEEDKAPIMPGIIYDRYDNNKYRDASDRQSSADQLLLTNENEIQNSMVQYLPLYVMHFQKSQLKNQKFKDDKYRPWTAYREVGQTPLQEITNMDMTDTAKSRQDKFTLKIPYFNYPKKSPTTTNTMVTTTSVQPQSQQPVITYIPQYRNNEELSGTDDLSDTPYFNKFGMAYPEYVAFYTGTYPDFYSNYNLDDNSNENENVYINLMNRNSAHHIKPSISQIPDYVLYTNISAQNNLAPTIPQMQMQFLDTYNLPENNIQAIQDDKYHSANPSDTSLYDTFSSPVYY